MVDVIIKEPLNLYKKEPSIRPEGPYDNTSKPMGADIHMKVDMGSKYVTKYVKQGVTPRDIDYDKMMAVSKPKTQACSFAKKPKILREELGSSYCSIPSESMMQVMTREEKIDLLNRINNKMARPKSSGKSNKKRSSIGSMNMSVMEYEEHQKKMQKATCMADQYLQAYSPGK